MFQEVLCTGADRRELRCSHEAKLLLQKFPHWLCFLYGRKGILGRFTWRSVERSQWQTAETSEEEALRFLQCGYCAVCRCLAACQLCLCPTTFEQLINTTFCPTFFRKFICQPLCCVLFQIQTFCQNLVLVANAAVTSSVTNFRCHKLITKVNK